MIYYRTMFALLLLLVIGGLVLGIVGFLGMVERLPRNNVAGVRTRATMRSDAAFRVGNKAAGMPTLAGGCVGLAGAVAAWVMPTEEGMVTVVTAALVGMLVLTIAGGVIGARAASAVNDQESEPPTG